LQVKPSAQCEYDLGSSGKAYNNPRGPSIVLLELHVRVFDSSESVQSPAQANLGTRGDLCKTGSDHPEDESAAEGIETRDKQEDDEGRETRGDHCKTGSDHPEDESAAEGIETRDKQEDDEGREKHESQVDSWQVTRIRRRGEPQASLGLLIQCCTAC